MKNYYGTLSGSHGRSFRMRHVNCVKRLLAEKSRRRHIRLVINLVISETMHHRLKVAIERYQEVVVALSESVM